MTGGHFNLSFDLWKTDRYDRNRCGNDTHELTLLAHGHHKTIRHNHMLCVLFHIALDKIPLKTMDSNSLISCKIQLIKSKWAHTEGLYS